MLTLIHSYFCFLVLASGAAVLAWFGLYKFIYKQSFSPGLPGEGLFKYVIWKDPVNNLLNKNRASNQKKSSESKWSSKVRKNKVYSSVHVQRYEFCFLSITILNCFLG